VSIEETANDRGVTACGIDAGDSASVRPDVRAESSRVVAAGATAKVMVQVAPLPTTTPTAHEASASFTSRVHNVSTEARFAPARVTWLGVPAFVRARSLTDVADRPIDASDRNSLSVGGV
jgi:hypothetical protein